MSADAASHGVATRLVGVNTVPPPRSGWLDDRLVVGRSRIQGRGLFARDFVPTGEVVVRLGGTLVTSLELRALLAAADSDPEASYVDTVTVEEDVHLVMPPGTTIHFANHCCDPSLWHVGPYEIATRRDLRNGDEATVDYATHTGAEGFRHAVRLRSPDLPRSGHQPGLDAA